MIHLELVEPSQVKERPADLAEVNVDHREVVPHLGGKDHRGGDDAAPRPCPQQRATRPLL